VMMVAMMFPSVAPMVLAYASVTRARSEGYVPTAAFVLGYLIVWTAAGLVPLAVLGGGGGIGGAFISRPLAIVVIGGLFTSTVLTLILVPVLYSLASRFASRRSTADLDALLDAAEDRRFKPLGLREGAGETPASRVYAFSLTLEPEPGPPGDPSVLQALAQNGLTVEPVAGTAKMRISVPAVRAASTAEATAKARDRVRQLVPVTGYRLSEPEPLEATSLANGLKT